MQVNVYRSSIKEGMYVYVASPDDLEKLPDAVMAQLGTPELALEFDLTADRSLENANAKDVLHNIATQGFHIQMPRDIETILADITRSQNQNTH